MLCTDVLGTVVLCIDALDTKDNATDTLGIVCCALYTLCTTDLLDVGHTLGTLDNTPVALEVENKSAGALSTVYRLDTLGTEVADKATDTTGNCSTTPVFCVVSTLDTVCNVTEVLGTLSDTVVGTLDTMLDTVSGVIGALDVIDALNTCNAVVREGIVCVKNTTDA